MIDNANIKDWQKRTHLDDFAKTHDFSGVCCTSAKENKNIEECFQQLLGRKLLNQMKLLSEGWLKISSQLEIHQQIQIRKKHRQ